MRWAESRLKITRVIIVLDVVASVDAEGGTGRK